MIKTEKKKSTERELNINGTKIRIVSIFSEKTKLESAMKNIVARKISEHKKAS